MTNFAQSMTTKSANQTAYQAGSFSCNQTCSMNTNEILLNLDTHYHVVSFLFGLITILLLVLIVINKFIL